jgi:Holliday junction resolvase RusA-like endonuclease|tara:strand:- start:9447 stop:9830 length:384 start_codon:yes stop_codon:yes gene_type:complete
MSHPEEGYFVHVDERPVPKERPRVTKNGHAFTPKKTLDYERKWRDAWEAAEHPTFDQPVGIEIILSRTSATARVYELGECSKNWGGDIDNILKCVLDGLQQGKTTSGGKTGAFVNDSQVRQVDIIKL